MRTRTHATAAGVVLLLALTACGSDTDPATTPDATPAASNTATKATAAHLNLEPAWRPKLEDAAGPEAEATATCQTPSTDDCAAALTKIMEVVYDIEAAIEEAAAEGVYRETLQQIGEMTDATDGYLDDGCQGDPAADLDGSPCYGHGVGITMGAVTLTMSLSIDESKAEGSAG